MKKNIGFLGFGNMGKAIFNLLQKSGKFKNKLLASYVYDVKKSNQSQIKWTKNLAELYEKANILFLCIKPQDFKSQKKEFLKQIKELQAKEKIIISIMAGVSLSSLRQVFQKEKLIRAMPNLPLLVGKGVIGYHLDKKNFTRVDLNLIEVLFQEFGEALYLKKEDEINKITAVSGSGPAYLFLFLNALIKSAQNLGFNQKQAEALSVKTIKGALSYYLETKKNQPNLKLDDLINQVASKGGTTEAALNQIGIDKFYKNWENAIKKAYKRAEELSE
jgi:pyrroline-5-carboxylate reductase